PCDGTRVLDIRAVHTSHDEGGPMGEQLRRDRPAPPPLGDRAPDARGAVLEIARADNDPVALSLGLAKAGPDPEVVLEATYGWSWAADLLPACGARVHLAHPLGSRCSATHGARNHAPAAH